MPDETRALTANPRDKLHTIHGRLFQAQTWREYAMCWHGRRPSWDRVGIDQEWCERIGRFTYRDCLRRSRVNSYLARRLNRRIAAARRALARATGEGT